MKNIKHYVDGLGNSLGSFEGALPPEGYIEVPNAPRHGLDIWSSGKWNSNPQVVIEKTNQEALAYLNSTDWTLRRHNDEQLSGSTHSLTAEGLSELLRLRQEARDAIK